MTLTTYLLYLAAVALLVLSPGPTMLMCITTSINRGPRHAVMSALGSASAVFGVMLLSALGLGALLSASEVAFTGAKVVGAAYLIWLGIKTFRSEATVMENSTATTKTPAQTSCHSVFLRGFLVGASNPKALLFFAAFFPQFLNPTLPFAPQFGILSLTFVAFEMTVLTACALGISRIAPLMGTLLLFTRRHA